MSSGNENSVAISPKGQVYTWGSGKNGKLGHGNDDDVMRPKEVQSFAGKKVNYVSSSYHTAVVTSEGDIFTWYANKIDFQ